MAKITKLDLGGTACYVSKGAVIVSLDGTTSDDMVTPVVIADYNKLPFSPRTFKEAYGTCYLEDTFDAKELFDALEPGGTAKVFGCQEYNLTDAKDLRRLAADVEEWDRQFEDAGFEVTKEVGNFIDLEACVVSTPVYKLRRPKYQDFKPRSRK